MLRRRSRLPFLQVVVLLVGLAGCKGLFPDPGLPDDPLFIDRKPLEAKARLGPPVPVVVAEPTPPANPYFAGDPLGCAAGPQRREIPGVLTNRPDDGEPPREP
jgi:hypothetical protein